MESHGPALTDGASVFEEAKATATYYLRLKPLSAHECPMQGMADRTVKADMVDGITIIVQPRSESIHEDYARQAHQHSANSSRVLVCISRPSPVPNIYVMPLLPGPIFFVKDTDNQLAQCHTVSNHDSWSNWQGYWTVLW
jgi:hypothetical protein